MIPGQCSEASGKSANPPPSDAQVHALREPHVLLLCLLIFMSVPLFTESKWKHFFQPLQYKGELKRVRLILKINRLYLVHCYAPAPLNLFTESSAFELILVHTVNSPLVILSMLIILVTCRLLMLPPQNSP